MTSLINVLSHSEDMAIMDKWQVAFTMPRLFLTTQAAHVIIK